MDGWISHLPLPAASTNSPVRGSTRMAGSGPAAAQHRHNPDPTTATTSHILPSSISSQTTWEGGEGEGGKGLPLGSKTFPMSKCEGTGSGGRGSEAQTSVTLGGPTGILCAFPPFFFSSGKLDGKKSGFDQTGRGGAALAESHRDVRTLGPVLSPYRCRGIVSCLELFSLYFVLTQN